MSDKENRNYTGRLIWIYVLWLMTTIALAHFGIYASDPTMLSQISVFIIPSVVFIVWFRNSRPFQRYIMAISPYRLTRLHLVRLGGPFFMLGYMFDAWPLMVALPGMLMDLTLGMMSPWIASLWRNIPYRKRLFVGWHVVGIVEVLTMVVLRILSSPTKLGIFAGEITSHGANLLPWSILPAFLAPNLILWHIVTLSHGLRRKASDPLDSV